MNVDRSMHIPWAQLPVEARFCFVLFFSGVFGPEEIHHSTVVRELAEVWNSEQLTVGIFNDDDRFWALYRAYRERYRGGVWRLDSCGISREEAELAGFIKPRADTAIAHLCPGGLPRPRRQRTRQ